MIDLIDGMLKIISFVPYIIALASLISAITPTPKDDIWIGKIYKILDWASLNIGKAKMKADDK